MAMKVLKCPNCEANVELDGSKAYGFCSYCGAQIQLREIVEVRHAVEGTVIKTFEKLIEDGDAHLKFQDYYQAEMVFLEAIRDYPARAQGYERMIKTVTRDYTLFLEGNQDRVYNLMNKMTAVALPEEKEYYDELKERIIDSFIKGIEMQRKTDMQLKVQEYDKKIKQSLVIAIVAVVFALVLQSPSNGSYFLSRLGLMSCIFMVGAVIEIILYKIRRDKLLAELGEE